MDEPELSDLVIHSDHSESEFFPRDTQGRACIFWFFCVLDQASKQLKEMSDQAKAVKEESTQDGAPLLAHGKATDSRSILKHRMRSPVKRLRSNGDRGTLVVRRSSALVAWRWAQISDHVVLY